MIRLLNDTDVNDIVNFEKVNVIRNGSEFFCDLEMNKIYLSNYSLLRKCLFDGTIMLVGEYDQNGKLLKICMFALPYESTKSCVVKIFFSTKDALFIKEAIKIFVDFVEGSIYSKIRITTHGEKNNDSLLKVYEENDMQCESVVETNSGRRYVYSKFIVE